jgi:hypothetical protein
MLPGSPDVSIGCLPAARVGDIAICAGGPAAIIKGSATVSINNMAAARLGDSTAHGGVIVNGCPTVFIDDVQAGPATSQEPEMYQEDPAASPQPSESERNRPGIEPYKPM